MRRDGQITVFLSMCLVCVAALICVMLESARLAGSRYYFQVAVNGGLDTLFSRYHRRLWEEYRILALEYGSSEELEKDLETYVSPYLETENWYPMKLEAMEVTKLTGLADEGGEILAEEVLKYMKYGIVSQYVIHPGEGDQFLKDVTEGAQAGGLTDAYSHQEKEVRKLEQAVKKLADNIKKQEELADDIGDALEDDDVWEFSKAAKGYRKTAEKYPELMKKYEKQAEALAKKQQESRAMLEEVKPDLQEDRGTIFEDQWNPYDAYRSEDEARYQKLLGQAEATEKNLLLLERTESLVEELAEDEDEDEEDDDWSLDPAAQVWSSQYQSSKISTDTGTGDKEKQNLLDQVQAMAGKGLLTLVMPEGTIISEAQIPVSGLSSQGGSGRGSSFADRVLIDEYCGHFFPNALTGGERRIRYELEYLLQGEDRDRKNLEKTVAELFAVREGLNLIHILSDEEKRQEARALALVITGSTGLAPLADIAACLIMGIWAMGESIQDLRILMSGGKVPLWKQKEDWKVSLDGLLDMGRRQMPDIEEEGKGFSYESYVKLLLLKEEPGAKHMRMLELIQINIRQEEPGFLVDHCAYYVDIRGRACGKHAFLALPLVKRSVTGSGSYALEARAEKAY